MTDDLFDQKKHKLKDRHNLMAYESERKHWIVGYGGGEGMALMKTKVFLNAQDAEDFVLAVQAHGMGQRITYALVSYAARRERPIV